MSHLPECRELLTSAYAPSGVCICTELRRYGNRTYVEALDDAVAAIWQALADDEFDPSDGLAERRKGMLNAITAINMIAPPAEPDDVIDSDYII